MTGALARAAVIAGWVLVFVVTAILAVQRYRDALASGLGMDLEFILEGAALARSGGDIYDADWYTYSPLLAWALAPLAGNPHAMAVWTAASLAAGLLAIVFVVATDRRRLPGWRALLVTGVAVVTLLYSNVLSIELFLGQNQLVLLALIALAVLLGARSPLISGVVLGVVALVKTWPVLLWLWLVRLDAPHRLRAVAGAVGTVVAFVIAMAAIGGIESVGRWVGRTFEMGEQPLSIFSVWYFARQWFPGTDVAVDLADAPPAGQLVSWLLVAGIVALIAIALLRPGTPPLAMWNLAGATILLLPVSHPFYRLLMLPLLWVWVAELLASKRSLEPAIAVAVLAAWWVIVFRTDGIPGADDWFQLVVVVSTIVALTTSVLLAARIERTAPARTPAGAPLPSGVPGMPSPR